MNSVPESVGTIWPGEDSLDVDKSSCMRDASDGYSNISGPESTNWIFIWKKRFKLISISIQLCNYEISKMSNFNEHYSIQRY